MPLPLLLGATVTSGPLPALVCHRAEGRVVVDGKLDDPAWRGTAWTWGFVLLGSGKPARAQTLFATLYDDRNLYVAVECMEPNVKGIIVRHRERDSSVWFDDAVEVFVAPGRSRSRYFQFVVNAAGVKFDCEGRKFDGISTDHSWNGNWLAAAKVGRDSWTVELAIPFSTLGLEKPRPWEVLGFNVCRDRQPGGEGKVFEWSSWAPLVKGFHEPENFGLLVLVPPGAALPPLDLLPLLGERDRGVRVFCRDGVLEFLPQAAVAGAEVRPLASQVEQNLREAGRLLKGAVLGREERERLGEALSDLWRRLAVAESPLRWGSPKGWLKAHSELEKLVEDSRRLLWEVKFALLFAE